MQTDEQDMGISYEHLDFLLKARKMMNLGYRSLLSKFIEKYGSKISNERCTEIVKKYYRYFCGNRHKVCTLPAGVHLTGYNTDNDRFDRRPLFYPSGIEFEEYMMENGRKRVKESGQKKGTEKK